MFAPIAAIMATEDRTGSRVERATRLSSDELSSGRLPFRAGGIFLSEGQLEKRVS